MGPTEWTAIMGAGVTLVGFGISWGVLRTIIKNHSGQLIKTSGEVKTIEDNLSACKLRSVLAGTKANEMLITLSRGVNQYADERRELVKDLQLHREDVISRLVRLETLIRNGGKSV